jgi:polysaccharide export outer membrane protein
MGFAKRVTGESKGVVCTYGVALLVLGSWIGLGVAVAQTPPQQTSPQQPPAQAAPAPPATDSSKPASSQPGSTQDTKPNPDAKPESKKGSSKDKNDPTGSFTTELPKNLNDQPEFIIGPGDGLMINVWKEPEVSTGVVVRGDCRITLNLIKDVEVCGMTPTQIGALLTEKLSTFIAAPDVTVTLTGLQSRKVYFIGQVRRPGAMVLNGPMTIAQALSDAGGLADFANDKKVIIQREENGKQLHLIFNYRDYLKGKNPKGNILLQPGDIIIVR